MPKIIYNALFVDGRDNSSERRNYLSDGIDYNGTREGVDVIDLLETLQYNAERPGVDIINDENISHGLFNQYGKCNLDQEKIDMLDAYDNGAIVWKSIISMYEDDAVEKGLISWRGWKDLIQLQVPKFAEVYGMDLNNFRWNAAFHKNTDNPHIHLTFYSTDPNEGRLSRNDTIKSFSKIKSTLVNELFKEELADMKREKTELRNNLKDEIASKGYFSLSKNEVLRDNVENILNELPRTGKKQYGYMPSNVKLGVNNILKEIVTSNNDIYSQFDKFRNNHEEFVKLYNSDDIPINKRMDIFDHKFFEPGKNDSKLFHNEIIKLLYKLNTDNELTSHESVNEDLNSNSTYNLVKDDLIENYVVLDDNTELIYENNKTDYVPTINYNMFCFTAIQTVTRMMNNGSGNKPKKNQLLNLKKKKISLEVE